MDKLAIVVQRYHSSIAGGSENYARLLAEILSEYYEVHILTTRSLNASTWQNEEIPVYEKHKNIKVYRFQNDYERKKGWEKIHRKLVESLLLKKSFPDGRIESGVSLIDWPRGIQEEWIRAQGPYSSPLFDYIQTNKDQYKKIFFITYLYAPAILGLGLVRSRQSVVVPTLHDEPPAYLSLIQSRMRSAGSIIWNTKSEKETGKRIWNLDKGEVLGFPVSPCSGGSNEHDSVLHQYDLKKREYFLYMGRNDPGKGLDYIYKASRILHGAGKIVMIGSHFRVPLFTNNYVTPGYVSPEEKCILLENARALLMPSTMESLSIATLEAMSKGVPVLGNENSSVVKSHILESGCGALWNNEFELSSWMRKLLEEKDPSPCPGGPAYVRKNYSIKAFKKGLWKILKS